MKVLVIFDGSDDGFAGLRTVAEILRAGAGNHEITAALVGWPPRRSPLWDRALTKHPILDDLHRAMAEVAAAEFDRLKQLLSPLGSVKTEYLEGNPIPEIIALIGRLKPELLIGGLTRGPETRAVHAIAVEILSQTTVPALMAYGS